jgi:cytochrome P450
MLSTAVAVAVVVAFLLRPKPRKWKNDLLSTSFWDRFGAIRSGMNRKSHEWFMSIVYKMNYADMFIMASSRTSIMLTNKDAAKQVLTQSKFVKGNEFEEITRGLLDHALFVMGTGKNHTKHRKLLQPGFGPSHLRGAALISLDVMNTLDRVWNEKMDQVDEIPVDMYSTFATVAIDIIARVAFGYNLRFTEKLAVQNAASWEAVEVLTSNTLIFRNILPKFLWRFAGVSSDSPKIQAARDEIFGLLRRLATERREALKNDSTNEDQFRWGMDVLQRLLKGGDDGSLTEDEIFGELLGFFLAGHETTSNTLTFALLELCWNPDIAEKIYEEIKEIDLSHVTSPLETVMSIKYLDNIFKETQRRHSIGLFVC